MTSIQFPISKTVAIIGGGPSGLVTAKSAVESNLSPTLFEKEPTVGGLWRPGSGSIWDNMRTNISHYTCMFSDHAWKKSTDDFPKQKEVFEYLCDYMKTFQLDQYLRLDTNVSNISPFHDQWKVEWSSGNQKNEQIFDFVIVASGIFSEAVSPSFPGMKDFKGQILHSKTYKNPEPFKNKTVAILGDAFSGCEIAAELASEIKKTIHVAPNSFWILPRYLKKSGDSGKKLPGDLMFYSRAAHLRSQGFSIEENNIRKNSWFHSICDQERCPELKITTHPKDPPFVTISDLYVENVVNKQIDVRKIRIHHLEPEKLVFDDGQSETVDSIICCTGYRTSLPFFGQEILDKLGFDPHDKLQPLLLHKTVFPKTLSGLAFVGLYRGPFFGVMELQARWACMAFSGQVALPSPNDIETGITAEQKIRQMQPRPQFPHGNYVGLCEDLARECNVAPDLEKIKIDDPNLYKQLVDGPFTIASYRLTGFGSNRPLALRMIAQINEAAD